MSHNPTPFKCLISKEEIDNKVALLAEQLNSIYKGHSVVIVAVLKGAICLLVDLMRQLTFDPQTAFIQASSYGLGGQERGELTIYEIGSLDVTGKDVLLIDDILDSGLTLQAIATKLKEKEPRSLKSAVLLTKKGAQMTSFSPDYSLFEVGDQFVIGYGLDYKEKYRNLPAIYLWEQQGEEQ